MINGEFVLYPTIFPSCHFYKMTRRDEFEVFSKIAGAELSRRSNIKKVMAKRKVFFDKEEGRKDKTEHGAAS